MMKLDDFGKSDCTRPACGRVYSLFVDGEKRLSTVDGKTAFAAAEKEAMAGHSILVKAENAARIVDGPVERDNLLLRVDAC